MLDTVYRIQDTDSDDGCYTATSACSTELLEMAERHTESDKVHPNPLQDIGIERFPASNEYCGFSTIQQLHRWFTSDEIAILWQHGFEIVKLIGVQIVAKGEKQVLFRRTKISKMITIENK